MNFHSELAHIKARLERQISLKEPNELLPDMLKLLAHTQMMIEKIRAFEAENERKEKAGIK